MTTRDSGDDRSTGGLRGWRCHIADFRSSLPNDLGREAIAVIADHSKLQARNRRDDAHWGMMTAPAPRTKQLAQQSGEGRLDDVRVT